MSSAQSEPPKKQEDTSWVQIGRFTQLALVLPAGTVAGWLLGTALDRWLHQHWISTVGFILGTVAGFVELIRTVLARSSQ
jgi:F0F1-type ATP synthase assembly protein I